MENNTNVEDISIYKKYNMLKKLVRQSNINKSGKQPSHLGSGVFYQLKDFVPTVEKYCDKLNLTTIMNINKDVAMLTLYDMDHDTSINFTVPFETSSNIKDAAQGNGAGITYTRRYVYVSMLDLMEADQLDGNSHNFNNKPTSKPQEYNNTRQVYHEPALNDEMNTPYPPQGGDDQTMKTCTQCGRDIQSKIGKTGNPYHRCFQCGIFL